jgi:hypothetical protein
MRTQNSIILLLYSTSIRSLEVYEQMMYCRIVLPFLLQYLTNTKHLIHNWSVTSKLKLMILSKCTYVWT